MSILLPNLDDRRWQDLVEQGRALIPLQAPEWTDHNASDPGITLIELLAWIAEGDLYRVNRITERLKRALLRLMAIRPEPPTRARVAIGLRNMSQTPFAIPAGAEWDATSIDGGAQTFRSVAPIEVVDAQLTSIHVNDADGFQNLTAAWSRGERLLLFGADPGVGVELYLGFDRPLPAGAATQVFFHIGGDKDSIAERRRLIDEGSAAVHHSARVVWEYFAQDGVASRWVPLNATDGTRAFTLSGAVGVRPSLPMAATTIGQSLQASYAVRCRLRAGALDAAPLAERVVMNGVELEQAVAVVETWTIAAGAAINGTVTAGERLQLVFELQNGAITALTASPAGTDAVVAFHVFEYVAASASAPGRLVIDASLAGTGTGEPEQRITLKRRPAIESTLRLYSLEAGEWQAWERVDDFAASSRMAAALTLDPTGGLVTFGDGEQGRTVPAGALLVAVYETTRASAATSRVTGLASTPRNRELLAQPGAASVAVVHQTALADGQAAETLSHAIGRAIALREAPLRAVTAEDCEILARETPGTDIARAMARPNVYPGLECISAPGVATVVVVPRLPRARPAPSAGLIRAVSARLERRRPLGTRIVVTWARYVKVAVHARVRAFDGIDVARLRADLGSAVDAWFHPLTGGPDGTGWPLGRDVYRSEILQVLDETPGVDHVVSLELAVGNCAPTCGNVCLQPTALVAAGSHQMEVL